MGHHTDLNGSLLIAMPGLGKGRLRRSVILLCRYSSDGAMGLILNKPIPGMSLQDLLVKMEITPPQSASGHRLYAGGPVARSQGFILHNTEGVEDSDALHIAQGLTLTASRDALTEIATGAGIETTRFFLGYSGWGPGKLEQEIARNDWLMAPCGADFVFAENTADKWRDALCQIGVDPSMLSGRGGRA